MRSECGRLHDSVVICMVHLRHRNLCMRRALSRSHPLSAPNVATEPGTLAPSSGARWLLLIHHLPGKPDYLRVKVRRRLARLGAVPLKNSVYVLPDSESAREDFQWLLREIEADGGEAALCASDLVDGVTDTEIRALFQREREAEYAAIIEAAAQSAGEESARAPAQRASLERRLRDALA